MPLTREQRRRYARHIALPEIGVAGQQRWLQSRVLLAGVGALGSAAGSYLAAAGVGVLGLADAGRLELSNLQRQTVYRTSDLGRPKVAAAAESWSYLNPGVQFCLHTLRLTAANTPALVAGYDVVVDALDTPTAKRMLARACHKAGIPYVHAGVQGFQGQLMTVLPGRTACWVCAFGARRPSTAERASGPFNALPGVLGTLQASETLKLLAGLSELLTDRILFCDLRRMDFRVARIERDPDCSLCGRQVAKQRRRPSHDPHI